MHIYGPASNQRAQALVVKYERKHARTKSIHKAVSLPQVLTASRAELGRPSSRNGPSRHSSRSRRSRRGAARAPPHRRSRASRRTRGPRARRRSARAEPRACGGGARAARRRAPLPSARPAPPRARASAAGGRRGPARAGERASEDGRCGAGEGVRVCPQCGQRAGCDAPPLPPIFAPIKMRALGVTCSLMTNPAIFQAHMHMRRPRDIARHTPRAGACAATGAASRPSRWGEVRLPSLYSPLFPRARAALRGRAERPRRRRHPVQVARVVFSCGARWQRTWLGILNSAGEQPAGCAAAGQQLLGPNTAGSPAARELEPPGGADALPATIAATTRNGWGWGCRWWCTVRAPPRGEEQLSQPRAHRPGGARTRAGGRGGRAREGTSRTAATGARSRWGQWRDTERRRKTQRCRPVTGAAEAGC